MLLGRLRRRLWLIALVAMAVAATAFLNRSTLTAMLSPDFDILGFPVVMTGTSPRFSSSLFTLAPTVTVTRRGIRRAYVVTQPLGARQATLDMIDRGRGTVLARMPLAGAVDYNSGRDVQAVDPRTGSFYVLAEAPAQGTLTDSVLEAFDAYSVSRLFSQTVGLGPSAIALIPSQHLILVTAADKPFDKPNDTLARYATIGVGCRLSAIDEQTGRVLHVIHLAGDNCYLDALDLAAGTIHLTVETDNSARVPLMFYSGPYVQDRYTLHLARLR